jgi:3-deoxy-D-manno-octulosonate 8-phosphate phosphatase (KDO 8-P phosphatase)
MSFPSIKLLLLDVDGVLTDGAIVYDSQGRESKNFHVRDGMGIVVWQKLGLRVGILSGRPSPVTTLRAAELKIDLVSQGHVMNKLADYQALRDKAAVTDAEVAYMGDDLADLPVLRRVGYPMTVADGAERVRSVAKFVAAAPAGRGAVREAIEHLIRGMGRWDEVLKMHGEPPA